MSFFSSLFKKRSNDDDSDNVSLAANSEILSRGSNAAKEINVGLTGVDNEVGTVHQKSLQSISSQRLSTDPLERQRNIKQQAGFSAEVLDTAKRNAKARLSGNETHYSRIDDVPGHAVNETPYDVAAYDATGNEIPGSAAQMKFIKSNPRQLMNELTGKAFREKYPHGSYMVASDDYDVMLGLLDDKVNGLQTQLNKANQSENTAQINRLAEELSYTKRVRKNLKRSELTRDEAIQARLNPVGVSVKAELEIGHTVGKQCAASAGAITGALSLVRNANRVIEGALSASEAAVEIGKDTAKATAKGYIIGQSNTILSAALKNSSKEVLRSLGKSNAPAYAISLTMSVIESLTRFAKGQLSSEQCLDEIAKSGTGLAGSAAGGAIGMAGGPVGMVVGSLIGGIITEKLYGYSSKLAKSARLAREERLMIESECEEIHRELALYRRQFEETYIAHTKELSLLFGTNLTAMAKALQLNDADSFIMSANNVTEALGGDIQFRNMKEFQNFMDSDDPFEL